MGLPVRPAARRCRVRVRIACERLAYGVRIDAPGWIAEDDCFCVEPGHPRTLALQRRGDAGSGGVRGRIAALNCTASVAFTADSDGEA